MAFAPTLTETPEEKKFILGPMLPRIIVGGFATLTLISALPAGFFVNMP